MAASERAVKRTVRSSITTPAPLDWISEATPTMVMATNVKGGGIIELIEHKSKPITSLPEGDIYGHRGILEIGYKVLNIEKVVSDFLSS